MEWGQKERERCQSIGRKQQEARGSSVNCCTVSGVKFDSHFSLDTKESLERERTAAVSCKKVAILLRKIKQKKTRKQLNTILKVH